MPTFNQISTIQLRSLCNALGWQSSFPEYLLLQRFLFEAWGEQEVPLRPRYRSLIGDDHSPYEYSIAFGSDEPELRLLLEAQAAEPSLQANREAALQLTRRLADVFPISLERLNTVLDLLCPPEVQGQFSLWHAVSLRRNQLPSFKIYMNPQVRGRDRAKPVVTEAFNRLGLQHAARIMFDDMPWRGDSLDELNYFSLDLSEQPEARVKVYFCHHGVTAGELERFFSLVPSHQPGDVSNFCHDMVRYRGPFIRKPLSSCFAFVQGKELPVGATLHLPVAHYATSDQVIAEHVNAFLGKQGPHDETYRNVLSKFPARSLASGTGIQSYTSFRREASGLRLTVYLSPGLFHHADELAPADQEPISDVFPNLRPDMLQSRVRS